MIRGFEEFHDNIEVEAPTAGKSTLRLVLAISANMSWDVFQTMDIKSAYLQGRKIERSVYIIPPKEVSLEGKLWKLRKTCYGLVDAAREWYFSLKTEIIKTPNHKFKHR